MHASRVGLEPRLLCSTAVETCLHVHNTHQTTEMQALYKRIYGNEQKSHNNDYKLYFSIAINWLELKNFVMISHQSSQ